MKNNIPLLNDIQFCKACMTDPLGRVFFYRGRVFRAIDPKSEAQFLFFLQSELYRKLLEKGWIVKTWVTKEISIEGYSLIVEHERMFVSRPQEWSFEMQKQVAITTLRMLELCNQYGYTFSDAMAGNFAFRNGRPVLIDVGALRVGKRDSLFEELFVQWQYSILSIYILNGGDQIDRFMHGQGKIYTTRFPQNRNIAPHLYPLYQNAIDHYFIYHHINSIKIKVRSPFWFHMAQRINATARAMSAKVGKRDLIKCGLFHYKSLHTEDIEQMQSPYFESLSFFDVDETNKLVVALSSKRVSFIGMSVVCIGNFEFSGLEILQHISNQPINVITHDMYYADTLYKQVHDHNADVNVICTDPVNMNATNSDLLHNYSCDIAIIYGFWDLLTTNSIVPFPVYNIESVAAMLASLSSHYVFVPELTLEQQGKFEQWFEQVELLCLNEIKFGIYRKRPIC